MLGGTSRQRNNKFSPILSREFLHVKKNNRPKFTEKIDTVVDVIDKKYAVNHIAKKYQVSFHTLQSWVRKE